MSADEFVHHIAIKLSRALNLNPNDLLARNVIDIAKSNNFDNFKKGRSPLSPLLDFILISTAARGFGNFQETFLFEVHSEVLSHAQQEITGHVPQPVQGITVTVHDSEVLEPEPARQGGLMRQDAVRPSHL